MDPHDPHSQYSIVRMPKMPKVRQGGDWAIITACSGTVPPFVYTAQIATLGANGSMTATGATYAGVYNLMDAALTVNGALPVGAVVELSDGNGGKVFSMAWYMGTYA